MMSADEADQLISANVLEREINVSVNWDTLGTYLGLSQGEIRQIESDHQRTERRRVAMFEIWLRKEEDPSWEKIIAALENMSEKSLSSRLRKKYATQDDLPVVTTPTNEDVPSKHEMTVERVLNVDRRDVIARELDSLKEAYLRLKMRAESALESVNPSPRQLKRFSHEYLGDQEVTTVEELFDCLKEFCFLDYGFLESIIKFSVFLDDKAQPVVSDLDDYIQQLKNFMKSTTLSEFMETIENAQKSLEGTRVCIVTLRLVGGWLPKTMQDLQKLLKEIFQDKSSVLAHLKIIRGSVIVTYLVSQSEAECLIQLAQAKIFFMIQVGVCELNIGNKRIIKSEVPHFSFESSLVLAVRNNDSTLLTFLLNINTSPDAIDGEGWTALMRGCFSGRDKAVSLLVDAKADPNIERCDGVTALYLAAQNGHSDVVDILLRAKANLNLPADDGTTPLDMARQNGHNNVVSTLQNLRTSVGVAKSFRIAMAATHPILEEATIVTTRPISEGSATMATTRPISEGSATMATTRPISEGSATMATTRPISEGSATMATTRPISEGSATMATTRPISEGSATMATTRPISEGSATMATTRPISEGLATMATKNPISEEATKTSGLLQKVLTSEVEIITEIAVEVTMAAPTTSEEETTTTTHLMSGGETKNKTHTISAEGATTITIRTISPDKEEITTHIISADGETPSITTHYNYPKRKTMSAQATMTKTHIAISERATIEQTTTSHLISEGETTNRRHTFSAEGATTITIRTILPDKEIFTTYNTISADREISVTQRTISTEGRTMSARATMSKTHNISKRMTIEQMTATHRHSISDGAKPTLAKTYLTIEEGAIKLRDKNCDDEMVILDDDNLQQIFEEATKPQSVSIITFGKSGSGKTSLSSAIANKEIDESTKGWDSSAKSTRRVRIQVDDGNVNVFDTPGVADTNLMGIDSKLFDSKIVIILCIDMYEGLDVSTLETLALLHKRFEWDFWFQVVIALTKADCYEELMSKSESETEGNCLTIKFAEELEKQRTILRNVFTATADQALPHCHIGMTEEEFDGLQIPIIPTSQLNQQALERMEQIDHGYWFDILLIKCCQRLRTQGSGLLVHQERLSQLPPEVVSQELNEEEYRRFIMIRRACFHDLLRHESHFVSAASTEFHDLLIKQPQFEKLSADLLIMLKQPQFERMSAHFHQQPHFERNFRYLLTQTSSVTEPRFEFKQDFHTSL